MDGYTRQRMTSLHDRSRRAALRAALVAGVGLALGPRLGFAQSAPTPFDADVGLDPGHSRVDVGASGAGMGEYQLTLDVAFRLKPLLEAAGLRVNLSRVDDNPVSDMASRDYVEQTRIEQAARIAAVGRVKIFVSIHFNAGPAGSTALRGTETYYNPDNAGDDSFRLATALQHSVVEALWAYGYQDIDRGVKPDLAAGKPYGHFFSLRGGMPSALVEGLFLSNPTEAALLLRDETRQAIAQGYAHGILEYFGR